jgi:acetoin utilization protein AcuB
MPASRNVGDCMTPSPVTVERSTTLAHALKLMDERNIRHLPVVDGTHLVGLVAERELRIVDNMQGFNAALCTVADFIEDKPYAVTADTPVREVVQAMASKKHGSAVVVGGEGGDSVLGVFTTTDALRVFADLLVQIER